MLGPFTKQKQPPQWPGLLNLVHKKCSGHPLWPDLKEHIDWEVWAGPLRDQDPLVLSCFEAAERINAQNPLFFHILQNERPEIWDRLRQPELAGLGPVLWEPLFDALQYGGLSALFEWLDLLGDDAFMLRLMSLCGPKGLGRRETRNLTEQIAHQYLKHQKIGYVRDMVLKLLSEEVMECLGELFGPRDSRAFVENLLGLVRICRTMELVEPTVRALQWLASSKLPQYTRQVNVDVPALAEALAQLQLDHRAALVQSAFEKAGLSRAQLEKFNKLKARLSLEIHLGRVGASDAERNQLQDFLRHPHFLAEEFLLQLLAHLPDHSGAVFQAIQLGEAVRSLFATSSKPNTRTQVFAQEIGANMRHWAETNQRFLGFLEKQPAAAQDNLRIFYTQVFFVWGYWPMVEALMDILEKQPAWISNFQVRTGAFSEVQLEELERLTLSVAINRALQSAELEPSFYALEIQRILAVHSELPLRTKFFLAFEQIIHTDLDFDTWLVDCLHYGPGDKRIIELLDLNNLTRLSLDEVRPLLTQYSVSLMGNLPIYEGKSPATDGKRVFLPKEINQFPDPKEDLFENRNASLYVGSLLHEICFHLLAGSFLVDARPTIEQFSNQRLAQTILNICEDFRGRAHFFAHQPREWTELVDLDERRLISAMQPDANWKGHFFQVFMCRAICQVTPGQLNEQFAEAESLLLQRRVALFHPKKAHVLNATLQEVLDLLVRRVQSLKGLSVADSLLLVLPIYQILSQLFGESNQMAQEPSDEETIEILLPVGIPLDMPKDAGRDVFVVKLSGSKTQREAVLRELAKRLRPFQKSANVPQAAEEAKRGKKPKAAPAPVLLIWGGGNDAVNLPSANVQINGLYSTKLRRMVQDGHRVVPITLKEPHPEYSELRRKHEPVFQAVSDAVSELQLQTRLIEQPGRDPDEIIVDAAIEGLIDPRSLPFLELYENEIAEQDDQIPQLEVKILVDASGSTGGEVLEVEKVFASVLYSAFTQLDWEVELFFFNTGPDPKEGYEDVTWVYRCPTLAQIGQVEADNANRDGAAIRYVLSKYAGQADGSLLILITDGCPSCLSLDFNQALEDALHAMHSARQKDVILRYFNIGGLPDEVLEGLQRATKNPQSFVDPKELVAYAPVFVADLVNELRGRG